MEDCLHNGQKQQDIEQNTTLLRNGEKLEVSLLGSVAPIQNSGEGLLLLCLHDITKRKQAEEAVKVSEKKFRELVNNMQVGVLLQGPKAEMLLCNPQSLELLGLSEEQLLGKTSFDPDWNVIHEDGTPFPGPDHPVPQAIVTKMPVHNVIMGVYRPLIGDRTWLLVDAVPRLGTDGNVEQVVCTFIDITKRILAQKALSESEEKYKDIANLLPQIVFESDLDWKLSHVNKNAFKILGYPDDYNFRELYIPDLVIPEHRRKALYNLQSDSTGKQENLPNEYTMQRNDGTTFQALVYTVAILKDTLPVGLRGIILDITDRKLNEEKLRVSEKRYRLLVETANEGILVAQDAIVKFANPKLLEISGHSLDEVLQSSIINFVHSDDQKMVMEKYLKRLSGETVEQRYPIRVVKKDGSIIWIEMSGVLIDWEGRPATLNFMYDITERKKAEEGIKVHNEELQKINAEKDKFFSIIAHDLRSPFNGFLGLTQLMAEELDGMTLKEIQKIALGLQTAANNLFGLLENLLEWSRVQQGLLPFSPKPLELSQFINESISFVLDPAKLKDIAVDFIIPENLIAFADEYMLQTVLRNLVSNAVKFTPHHGKVEISAKRDLDDFIIISVKDTGIGINDDMIKDLFKIDISTNRRGTMGEPSSGLGLILCKEFIEKNSGRIWVESKEGEGSVFHFTVPVHKKVNTGNEYLNNKQQPTFGQLNKLKILIAEDDEISEMLISIAIKNFVKEIIKVKTGLKAVEACLNHPDIDLVIMDMEMPEMDGNEATKKIRQFNKDVIIIAQSAYIHPLEVEMAMKAGCNSYLKKPIPKDGLAGIIEMYFDQDGKV